MLLTLQWKILSHAAYLPDYALRLKPFESHSCPWQRHREMVHYC